MEIGVRIENTSAASPLQDAISEIVQDDGDKSVAELIGSWLRKHISKFDAVLFSLAFLLGMLAHLYMFTHKFINHDDVDGLYSSCEFGLSSGRWLLQFVTELTGGFSSSWIHGLVGIFCLAVSVVFVARIFGVRHYVPAALIALVMVTFPAVASTYAYMFCSYQYLISLMLTTLGAYCIHKSTLPHFFVGSILIALGMGCYQAYFAHAAVLLVAVLLIDICFDRYHGAYKKAVLSALRYVLGLLLGMLIYFAVLKLCLWATGTTLTSYQGIDAMGRITFSELARRVASAYWHSLTFYMKGDMLGACVPITVLIALALCIAAVILCVRRNLIYRSFPMLVLLIADAALLPLGANLVYVMVGPDTGVHIVMQYAMAVPLILPAVFADGLRVPAEASGRDSKNIVRRLIAVLAVLLLLIQLCLGYEFFLTTNRAYFDMDITYENVYAYYVKLTAKLELQDGFTKDQPIAFIGEAELDAQAHTSSLIGVLSTKEAANMYSRYLFFKYFLASEYNWVGADITEQIKATDEFLQMPCYPSEGSIKTINGVIVVKFS